MSEVILSKAQALPLHGDLNKGVPWSTIPADLLVEATINGDGGVSTFRH
jgi:hypothetical protein